MVYHIILLSNSTFSIIPNLTRKREYCSIGKPVAAAPLPAGDRVVFVLIDIMACIGYIQTHVIGCIGYNTRTTYLCHVLLFKDRNNIRVRSNYNMYFFSKIEIIRVQHIYVMYFFSKIEIIYACEVIITCTSFQRSK